MFHVAMAVAAFGPGTSLLGQEVEPPAAAALSEAEKRLQWLKARTPAKAAPAPKAPVSEPSSSAAVPEARPKVGFRSSGQRVGPRMLETPPGESSPKEKRPTVTARATSTPAPAEPAKKQLAGKPPASGSPAPVARTATPTAAPAPASRTTAQKAGQASPKPLAARSTPAPTPSPAANPPARKSQIAEKSPPKATPLVLTKLMPPPAETSPVKTRSEMARATPSPKPTLAPAITAITTTRMIPGKTQIIEPDPEPEITTRRVSGRYPWKTSIITTVFWVGEKPSGNNFTPNHASSWDMNWAQNFGGFDNPDPAARRNYLPAKFTPRQNPFYCALPYNDVTRGTTKPESRRVIPWFRQAYVREGQSVCRDRWVAIRNRAGKVAYAQWSDCGPFRTDHWQYVFGNERPKPNLNKGAGLDVSPAVRDYLGLAGTDVTDWKFVDLDDVPHGPWATHGTNNTAANRSARKRGVESRSVENVTSLRGRKF